MDAPRPADPATIQRISAVVHARLQEGASPRQIAAELVQQGLDPDTVTAVLRNLDQVRSPRRERQGGKSMLIGGLVFGGGLLVTMASFAAAGPGEGYVVAVGALVLGAVVFLVGLVQSASGH
jgi:hypothetical protein